MDEIQNLKLKIQKFGVHIKVRDFEKSYAFYKAFGLKPIFAYGDKEFLNSLPSNVPSAPEKYRGITFEIGGSLLEIANGHIAVKPEVFQEVVRSSKISAMIDVDNIDKVIEICEKNCFEIAVPSKKYPWGTIELVVKDPDGFILVFRQIMNT
jgi:uncharacterized glyoxalase superfamily protein PhnB